MPLMRLQVCASLSTLYNVGIHNSLRVLLVKSYSVYPPTFIKPVYHPEEIKKLSAEEFRVRLHKNVRAAESNQNASVFHDPLYEKLVNHVMKGGKKLLARQIIEEAFLKVKSTQVRKYHLAKDEENRKNILTDPREIFHKALQNCKPVLDVTPVKRGGVVYKVPVAINDRRATSLAFKWLVATSREHEPRRQHTGEYFSDRLAKELLDASENTGKTVKKKIELHKLCEANKAYAHYRWT
ncbi:30S ribosomal protein S7 [Thrips palmi]|uniref:30S ribosomal protein S7 n=1 Tax=Thrips palmi TaxID=161013 RepID=A0A6P8ZNS8_THRPL|nr:30S ribosomal protein S7 [Thrips palmi]